MDKVPDSSLGAHTFLKSSPDCNFYISKLKKQEIFGKNLISKAKDLPKAYTCGYY